MSEDENNKKIQKPTTANDIKNAVNEAFDNSKINEISSRTILGPVFGLMGSCVTSIISLFGPIIGFLGALTAAIIAAVIAGNYAQGRLDAIVQYTQVAEATGTQYAITQEYKKTLVATNISPGMITPAPTTTSFPTITPIPTSPTTTYEPGITQAPEKFIPEEVIIEYYDHLNWERYIEAWDMLDLDLRAGMDISFEEYVVYWENTIPVSITKLIIENETEYSADLIVSLYFDRHGYSKSHRFGIVYELPEDRWQIYSVVSY